MKTRYQILAEKILELEKDVGDGFDDAYVKGFRHVAKEFYAGDGEGDGGLTEIYLKGLKDAINLIDN